MSKIIDEFKISKYKVLKLDEMPESDYRKVRIDGEEFEPVPVYDASRCIAIETESQNSFIGRRIEFI